MHINPFANTLRGYPRKIQNNNIIEKSNIKSEDSTNVFFNKITLDKRMDDFEYEKKYLKFVKEMKLNIGNFVDFEPELRKNKRLIRDMHQHRKKQIHGNVYNLNPFMTINSKNPANSYTISSNRPTESNINIQIPVNFNNNNILLAHNPDNINNRNINKFLNLQNDLNMRNRNEIKLESYNQPTNISKVVNYKMDINANKNFLSNNLDNKKTLRKLNTINSENNINNNNKNIMNNINKPDTSLSENEKIKMYHKKEHGFKKFYDINTFREKVLGNLQYNFDNSHFNYEYKSNNYYNNMNSNHSNDLNNIHYSSRFTARKFFSQKFYGNSLYNSNRQKKNYNTNQFNFFSSNTNNPIENTNMNRKQSNDFFITNNINNLNPTNRIKTINQCNNKDFDNTYSSNFKNFLKLNSKINYETVNDGIINSNKNDNQFIFSSAKKSSNVSKPFKLNFFGLDKDGDSTQAGRPDSNRTHDQLHIGSDFMKINSERANLFMSKKENVKIIFDRYVPSASQGTIINNANNANKLAPQKKLSNKSLGLIKNLKGNTITNFHNHFNHKIINKQNESSHNFRINNKDNNNKDLKEVNFFDKINSNINFQLDENFPPLNLQEKNKNKNKIPKTIKLESPKITNINKFKLDLPHKKASLNYNNNNNNIISENSVFFSPYNNHLATQQTTGDRYKIKSNNISPEDANKLNNSSILLSHNSSKNKRIFSSRSAFSEMSNRKGMFQKEITKINFYNINTKRDLDNHWGNPAKKIQRKLLMKSLNDDKRTDRDGVELPQLDKRDKDYIKGNDKKADKKLYLIEKNKANMINHINTISKMKDEHYMKYGNFLEKKYFAYATNCDIPEYIFANQRYRPITNTRSIDFKTNQIKVVFENILRVKNRIHKAEILRKNSETKDKGKEKRNSEKIINITEKIK